MGRVSRYKKIKSCDPFAKRLQKVEKVDTIHDQPPDEFHEKRVKKKRKRSLDWDNEDDREVLLQIDAKKVLAQSQQSQETSKTSVMNKLEGKRADETMKDFMKRIRIETRKTLAEQMKKHSSTAQKRKQHLKEKKKAKKMKKLGNRENYNDDGGSGSGNNNESFLERKSGHKDYEFPRKDAVKFGETADRPPDLSSFQSKLNSSKEKSRIFALKKIHNPTNNIDASSKTISSHHDINSSINTMKGKKRSFLAMIGENSSDEYTTPEQSRLNMVSHHQRHGASSSSPSYSSSSKINEQEMERLRLQVQQTYKELKAKRMESYTSNKTKMTKR